MHSLVLAEGGSGLLHLLSTEENRALFKVSEMKRWGWLKASNWFSGCRCLVLFKPELLFTSQEITLTPLFSQQLLYWLVFQSSTGCFFLLIFYWVWGKESAYLASLLSCSEVWLCESKFILTWFTHGLAQGNKNKRHLSVKRALQPRQKAKYIPSSTENWVWKNSSWIKSKMTCRVSFHHLRFWKQRHL